jgi:hypothetical protein
LSREVRCVGRGACHYGKEFAPRNLSVRVVEVSVFWGVCPAECRPYPEGFGPRSGVDRTGGQRRCGLGVNRTDGQRRCGLEVEAEATEAGV